MNSNSVIYNGNDSDFIPGTEEELINTSSTPPPSKSDFSQLQMNVPHLSNSITFFPCNERQDSRVTECKRNRESTFKQSNQTANYLGKKVPINTTRASKGGFKIFAEFVLDLVIGSNKSAQYNNLAQVVELGTKEVPDDDDVEKSLMEIILSDNTCNGELDKSCPYRLRHFLIEFCVR